MTKEVQINKRRDDGEGSVNKVRNRIWLNGKRHAFYGRTKGELKQKIQEAKRLAKYGVEVNNKETMAKYMSRWISTGDKKQKTIDSRRICMNRMLPHIGHIKVSMLTAVQIDKMYKELASTGLSARSVRQTHEVLSKALNDAKNIEKSILINPVENLIQKPQPSKIKTNFLEKNEVEKLLAVDSDWTPLFTFLIHTGLRRGEALGLAWDCVDMENKTLEVKQSLISVSSGKIFTSPKTKESHRIVTLNPIALAALRTQRNNQSERKLRLGEKWGNTGLVFTNEWGKALAPSSPNTGLKKSLAKAGIQKHIRLHDLRHTCATLMLEAGAITKQIQDALGHKQYSTTMEIYGHVTEPLSRDATDKLAQHLA